MPNLNRADKTTDKNEIELDAGALMGCLPMQADLICLGHWPSENSLAECMRLHNCSFACFWPSSDLDLWTTNFQKRSTLPQ